YARRAVDPLASVEPICKKEEIIRIQTEVRDVAVKEPVARYLLEIVHKSRQAPSIERGVSPRGALAFFRATQARALLPGRAYLTPEDVHALAGPVLAHRLQLTTEARYGGVSAEQVLAKVTREIRVPT